MKKLFCLMLSVMLVLSFAACGGETGDDNSQNESVASGSDTAAVATSIKFDAESYTIKVEGFITLSKCVTIEPAGADITFSSSDESIAEVASAKKGEVNGVKPGEVTITASSADGSVTATCKLSVVGLGTIVARDGNDGGITNKRWDAVERPDDADAKILVVSKSIVAGTDMSKAVAFDYGAKLADGSCTASYDGFYIAKTGDAGNYKLENVPAGDYVGIIVSSRDYTPYKDYSEAEALSKLKSSALAPFFSDSELASMAKTIYNREFHIAEFTLEANQTYIFGCHFAPNP